MVSESNQLESISIVLHYVKLKTSMFGI